MAQLSNPFECRSCKRRYRVHADGRLVEIVPPPTFASRMRDIVGGLRRLASVTVVIVMIGLVGWGSWLLAKPPALEPLPEGLNARVELMGRAWAGKDLVLMRRLTGTNRGRLLHRWLLKHPAPDFAGELSAAQMLRHAQVEMIIEKQDPKVAQLTIRVSSPTGPSAEISQNWACEGDEWFFTAEETPRPVMKPSRQMRMR